MPEDENSAEVAMRAALANRYATVRPFLALLGESKALDAASAGKRVLAGVRGLPALARRKVGIKPLLPREVDDKLVPPAWRKAVYANPDLPQGAVDRDAYVVCVLEQLHRALNNRDVFAAPSHRWSNPRARLLDGTPTWCSACSRSSATTSAHGSATWTTNGSGGPPCPASRPAPTARWRT
ncbi:hypothetical protein ACH5AG_10295 [Streptomyces anulatus]